MEYTFYTTVLFLFAVVTYFIWKSATIIHKLREYIKHDEVITEEFDKTIDGLIKKISILEYQIKMLSDSDSSEWKSTEIFQQENSSKKNRKNRK